MLELILPALLAGLMLAMVSGPLGAFVVWGRMAYFGDTLAHSALLGVGLALMLKVHLLVGVLAVTLMIAGAMSLPASQQRLGNDTLLGILAHGTLALGLVMVSLIKGARVDMTGLLFGDVLAASTDDVTLIAATCTGIGAVLLVLWRPLLNLVISPELAAAEGLPVRRLRLVLMVLLALTVAVGMRVVGALLMTALLIIPAACARQWAKTPEQMAAWATVVGATSVCGGLVASFLLDTPAGPSIVLAASLLFITSRLLTLRSH